MEQNIVLKQYKDSFLMLLVHISGRNEFVVCRNWNGNSWYWGHYFDNDLDGALEYFNKDRMEG